MNTAYRLIWDDLRGMLVIVDENSRSRGKKAGKGGRRAALPAAALFALGLATGVPFGGGEAWAGAVCVEAGSTSGTANGTNSVACGRSATVAAPTTTEAYAQNSAYDSLQSAIKANKYLSQQDTVTSATKYSDLYAALNALTSSSDDDIKKAATTAKGNLDTYVHGLTNSDGAVAVGASAQATGDGAIAIGQSARAFTQDQQNGNNLRQAAPGAIAVGNNAWAMTPYSVVIGSGNTGQQGLGGRAKLLDTPEQGGYSVSIGTRASNFGIAYSDDENAYYANTKYSTAIGYAAHTHAANATAIGTSTDATGERSFAFGTATTNLADKNDTAHNGSRAAGQGSIVIGDQATTYRYAKKDYDGTQEKNATGADVYVNDSMAMGTGSWAKSRNAVALGGGISYTWHEVGTDANGNTQMTNVTKYYDGSWQDEAEGAGALVGLNADGAVAIGGASATITALTPPTFPRPKLLPFPYRTTPPRRPSGRMRNARWP